MQSQTSTTTPSLSVVSLPDDLVAIAAANYLVIVDVATKKCLKSGVTGDDIRNNDSYYHTAIVDDEQMIRALCPLQLESSAHNSLSTVDYVVSAGDAKYINFYKVVRNKENTLQEENVEQQQKEQTVKSNTRLLECTHCYRYGPHTKRITQLTVCTKSNSEACIIFADKFGEVNQFTITAAQLERNHFPVMDNNDDKNKKKREEKKEIITTVCEREKSSSSSSSSLLEKCEFLLQHLSTISAMYLSPALHVSSQQVQKPITHNEAVLTNCEKIDSHTHVEELEKDYEALAQAQCNLTCAEHHLMEKKEQHEQCSLHNKRHLFTCDKEGHIRVSFYPETYIIDDFLWPHGKESCSATTCIINIRFCKHLEHFRKTDKAQLFYITGDYSGWIHFWSYCASATSNCESLFHLVVSVNCNNVIALQNSIFATSNTEGNSSSSIGKGTVGAVISLAYTRAETNYDTVANDCNTCTSNDGVCVAFNNCSAVLYIPLSVLTNGSVVNIANYITQNAICYTLDTFPLAMCACNDSSLFVVERNGKVSLLELAVKGKKNYEISEDTNKVHEEHPVHFVRRFGVTLEKLFTVNTADNQMSTESLETRESKLNNAFTRADEHVKAQWCRNLVSILKEVDVFAHWNYLTHTLRSSKCDDVEFDEESHNNNIIDHDDANEQCDSKECVNESASNEETAETNDCDADNSVPKSNKTSMINERNNNYKKRKFEERQVPV